MKQFFSEKEIFPYTEDLVRLRLEYCSSDVLPHVCLNLFQPFTGYDTKQFNTTMLPIIFGHTPTGISYNQARHFLQLIQSSKFVRFDHGTNINKKLYGTSQPPKYKLKNISAPIILYYSLNDLLVEPSDVELLVKEIPIVREKYLITYKDFSHTDYMWAIQVQKFLYYPMVKRMAKADKQYNETVTSRCPLCILKKLIN